MEKISIAKLDADISTAEVGTECLICGDTIILGPVGYNRSYVPKICSECKRRLMLNLYPEREEDQP